MKKLIVAITLCLILQGCMSPEEQAALQAQQQATAQEQARQQAIELEGKKKDYCIQRGGKVGSKKYNVCIADLEKSITAYQEQQMVLARAQQERQRQVGQLRDLCVAEGLRQKKLGEWGWTDNCVRNEMMKRENPQQYQLELMERQTRALEQRNSGGSSFSCHKFGDMTQCDQMPNSSVGFHNLR